MFVIEQMVESGERAGATDARSTDAEPTGAAPHPALARLRAAVDEVLAIELIRLGRDELLAVVRDLEVQKRRLPVADHRLVAELESRRTCFELCEPSTARLLQSLLQLSAAQARGRVAAADELGPRRELSGAPLPPLFPAVAAAQATGSICERRARVITETVGNLPTAIQFRHAESVEAFLVEQAASFDACALAGIARRLNDTLDPDGTLTEDADHDRRREVRLRARPDGSGELTGHLTPSCLAYLQAILDPLAAPTPAADGRADPRAAGQRQHDALEAVARRLLRSDTLPTSGGTPATVLLTMTMTDLQSRTGYATTGHGGLIDLPTALRMASEARVIPVFMNDTGGIMAYGRGRRTASPSQRLALAARDGGCCFPGCTAPPQWCEVHHLRDWAVGGSTDISQMVLLCGYQHDHHRQAGWECQMIDGVPHWIPPAWIDPDRTPRRNTAQSTVLRFGLRDVHVPRDTIEPEQDPPPGQMRPDPIGRAAENVFRPRPIPSAGRGPD